MSDVNGGIKTTMTAPNGWSKNKYESILKGKLTNGLYKHTDFYGKGDAKILDLSYLFNKTKSSLEGCSSIELTEKEITKYKLQFGDILFNRVSVKPEGVGQSVLVEEHSFDLVYESNIIRSTLNLEYVNPQFISYLLNSEVLRKAIFLRAKITAQASIGQEDILSLELLLPPLPEQQKIGKILTSVDEVIEKTQAQIDKLKDLKTGMMQELLTKGIGHTEFKDSPVGRIPVGWEVKTIEDLSISVLDGDRGKEYPKEKDFFQHEHCLFLSAKNVTKKGFKFDVSMFITEKKDNAMRKGKLKRGDIVITTRGTLGNIAHFNTEIPFEHVRINSGMAIIRNDKTAINSEFLNILLNSPIVNEQTELLAFGSAIPQLTIGLLKNLNIPVPNVKEQNKISAMINSVSNKITLIESKLTSSQNTKKALMQDLLTGKVRVNTEQANT
jgi:type I restriction enzyme S subunit